MDDPNKPTNSPRIVLRASDMDRERTVAMLREHYTAGRLSFDEFQERLERAYLSKWLGELDILTVDLPAEESAAAIPRASNSRARGHSEHIRKHLLSYVLVMLFLVAIWAVSGGDYFWPVWPMLVWGLGLAFDVLGLDHPPHRRKSRRRRERLEHRMDRRDRRLGRDDDETR